MENITLIEFVMVFIFAFIIIIVMRKMSTATSYRFERHYRCESNFRHTFTEKEIKDAYGDKEEIFCPNRGCGGVLKLYRPLSDEEYKEMQQQGIFDE